MPEAIRHSPQQLCDHLMFRAKHMHSAAPCSKLFLFLLQGNAGLNSWNLLCILHFCAEDLSDANRQTEHFDFKTCNKLLILMVFHCSSFPKQRCSSLYSTYCQCIIHQFTVSGFSLNGTERSAAHKASLACQPRAHCVCTVCMYVKETSATVKCKRFSGSPLGH